MKKILSNMWVLIALVVLALAGLGLYIGLLARPISYGMDYTYSEVLGSDSGEDEGKTQVLTINFKSGKQVTMFNKIGEESSSMDFWYVQNGNKVWLVAPVEESITEEEFDQTIEALKANKEEWDAIWSETSGDIMLFSVNAFNFSFLGQNEYGDVDLTCTGSIIFAAVWGVVEVALIAIAALSLTFYLKNKKEPKVDSEISETEVKEEN